MIWPMGVLQTNCKCWPLGETFPVKLTVVVAIELQSTIGFVVTVAPFVTRMNPFVTQGAGSISAKYPKTRPWSSKVQVPTMFVIKPKIEVKLVELLVEVDELELMISLVLR